MYIYIVFFAISTTQTLTTYAHYILYTCKYTRACTSIYIRTFCDLEEFTRDAQHDGRMQRVRGMA